MAAISSSKSSVINCQSARRHAAENHLSHSIHIWVRRSIKTTNKWRALTTYILTPGFWARHVQTHWADCMYCTVTCWHFSVVANFYASIVFFLCGCPENVIRPVNNTRKCEKSALLCGKSVEWGNPTSAWHSLQINRALNSTTSPLLGPRCKQENNIKIYL